MKKQETRIVAFLDILGFQEHISDFFSGRNDSILKNIEDSFSTALEETNKFLEKMSDPESFSMKFFSDCICISMPIEENDTLNQELIPRFLFLITQFQYTLHSFNVFVRGGISVGKHIEDERIIFSEALVAAYKLENKEAIYPRILLDTKSQEYLNESYMKSNSSFLKDFIKCCILSEWNSTTFINPFGIVDISMNEEKSKNIFLKTLEEQNKISETNKIQSIDYVNKTTFRNIILDKQREDLYRFIESELIPKLNNKGENRKGILEKYRWIDELLVWTISPDESGLKLFRFTETIQS